MVSGPRNQLNKTAAASTAAAVSFWPLRQIITQKQLQRNKPRTFAWGLFAFQTLVNEVSTRPPYLVKRAA